MSKISLTSNVSGTGTLTIAAPNTNTDRTLTLPDENGTILTSASTINSITGITSSATATAISIDSSNRVTMPYQPSFFATRESGSSVTQSSGWSKWVTFDATQHNIGSHFSIANSRFTAPINGLYMFGANCRLDNVSAEYGRIILSINGSQDYWNLAHSIANTNELSLYHTMSVTAVYELSANDYVEVYSYSATDTNWNQQYESTFWGRLVG